MESSTDTARAVPVANALPEGTSNKFSMPFAKQEGKPSTGIQNKGFTKEEASCIPFQEILRHISHEAAQVTALFEIHIFVLDLKFNCEQFCTLNV